MSCFIFRKDGHTVQERQNYEKEDLNEKNTDC